MWVPKWQRDRKKGVDSPVPTQVVSNEEFIPRPPTDKHLAWERRIGELAEGGEICGQHGAGSWFDRRPM